MAKHEVDSLMKHMSPEASLNINGLGTQKSLAQISGDHKRADDLWREMRDSLSDQCEELNEKYQASQGTAAPPKSEDPQDTAVPSQRGHSQCMVASPKISSGSQPQESTYDRIFNAPVIGNLDVYPRR
jgi:hypothetical protein